MRWDHYTNEGVCPRCHQWYDCTEGCDCGWTQEKQAERDELRADEIRDRIRDEGHR